MNTYCLITPDGQSYGPVDENGLIHWAQERRVSPTSQIRCVETGVVSPASTLPFLGAALSQAPALAAPYAPVAVAGVGGHQLTEMHPALAILLNFVTCGLFSIIWLGLMHGKMPQNRPDDPSAGKAIGFMFIPFFSLYWIFFSTLRLCDRVDEQRRQAGLAPAGVRGMAMATCILMVIPYINLLIGIPIMMSIFLGMM